MHRPFGEGIRQLEEHSKAARKEKFKELVQEFDADLKKLFDASRNVVDAHGPIHEGSVEHNLKDALDALMR